MSKYFMLYALILLSSYSLGFLLKNFSLYFYLKVNFLYLAVVMLKHNCVFSFSSMVDLVVVDHPNRFLNRFELVYCFWNNLFNFRFFVKLMLGVSQPALTLSSFYPSCSWLEREAWDMFGVKFLLHKNLRRILTDYGFQGFPLRKDFPLIGFSELRYDSLYQSIAIEPVQTAQKFRIFSFNNPWSKIWV